MSRDNFNFQTTTSNAINEQETIGKSMLSQYDKLFPALSTGTTIVGICCSDGIVLGADTRATGGALVMDKEKLKIHTIAPRICCCAAGTSADCDQLTRQAGAYLSMLRIEKDLAYCEKSLDSVLTAAFTLSKYIKFPNNQRKPSSVLIVGGVDETGSSLYEISMDGSYRRSSYSALGSGSYNALATIEIELRNIKSKLFFNNNDNNNSDMGFNNNNNNNINNSNSSSNVRFTLKKDIHYDDDILDDNHQYIEPINCTVALPIIRKAVQSGIKNDLGSGSHVDICIITSTQVDRWRERLVSQFENNRHKNGINKNDNSNNVNNITVDMIAKDIDAIDNNSIPRNYNNSMNMTQPLTNLRALKLGKLIINNKKRKVQIYEKMNNKNEIKHYGKDVSMEFYHEEIIVKKIS